VLGELLLGVVLGNLALLGFTGFEAIPKDPIIAFIAELGVIVLLLQIGLETRLADLIKVGPRAFAVGGRHRRSLRAGYLGGRSVAAAGAFA
jgi:Kef-type K+ transport system membrane component KefB